MGGRNGRDNVMFRGPPRFTYIASTLKFQNFNKHGTMKCCQHGKTAKFLIVKTPTKYYI